MIERIIYAVIGAVIGNALSGPRQKRWHEMTAQERREHRVYLDLRYPPKKRSARQEALPKEPSRWPQAVIVAVLVIVALAFR